MIRIRIPQIDVDPATVPGGHGVHQSAVHLPNLKGDALDPLGLVKYITGTTTPLKGVTFLVTESNGKVLGANNGPGMRPVTTTVPSLPVV